MKRVKINRLDKESRIEQLTGSGDVLERLFKAWNMASERHRIALGYGTVFHGQGEVRVPTAEEVLSSELEAVFAFQKIDENDDDVGEPIILDEKEMQMLLSLSDGLLNTEYDDKEHKEYTVVLHECYNHAMEGKKDPDVIKSAKEMQLRVARERMGVRH